MKNVSILDNKGKVVGKVALDQEYFDGKVNKALLHQAVLMYLANKRHGTSSVKTRAEVSGGGRKPWRQKGTGRARVGSIRSPLWRGGGITFGPKPRKYSYSLTKNAKSLALRQSLNSKIKDDDLIIVDKIALDRPKTKEFVAFLSAVKALPAPLVVIEKYCDDILRAAGNIPGVSVRAFNNINAHDVLKHKKVIFSKPALENIVKLRKR